MPQIHIASVLIFSSVLACFLGALMLWLWLIDRNQKALASWGTARLIGSAGMVMIASRGSLPIWLSIDVANAMIALAYGLTLHGARQFELRRTSPALVVAGAAVWLAACQFPTFHQSLQSRVLLMGLVMASYNGAAMVEFIRGQARMPLPSRPLAIALLAGVTVTYAGCAVLAATMPPQHDGLSLPAASWFGIIAVLSIVFMVCSALLLVALTKEMAEVRSTAALARARDAADLASSHKTRFLSRMSHELRTPLNGVLGLAQALHHDPSLGPIQRCQAATLEEAGRHLLEILNEVLDMARIEAGRFQTTPRPLALGDFLRGTEALIGDSAAEKGIALRLEAAADLPEAVLADRLRLRQILMNLTSNAIKFTPAGGQVTLLVDRGEGIALRFSVIDTGPGVPEALRPRLFQDFVQAAEDTSRASSGLGLAISAQLARAMGGSLSHADGPGGRGSRFTLDLPLPVVELAKPAMPMAAPGVPPDGHAAAAGRLRILVVDDIAANRMVVRALLGQLGHAITEAPGGAEALALLEQGPLPDVVLLDENMPDMDGRTTARHIRAMPEPACRLPIIAVTADALPEQVAAILAAGMDGHVAKPVDREALLRAIAAALAAKPRRDAAALVAG